MLPTDEAMRAAAALRVADAPEPPNASQIAWRAARPRRPSQQRSNPRRSRMGGSRVQLTVVGGLAAAALTAGAVMSTTRWAPRDHGERQGAAPAAGSSSATITGSGVANGAGSAVSEPVTAAFPEQWVAPEIREVGAYFLPDVVPEGYRLLSVSGAPTDGFGPATGASLYESTDGTARIYLSTGEPAGRWGSGSRTNTLADGTTVRWSELPNEPSLPLSFQVDFGDALVEGEALGLGSIDPLSVFAGIRTAKEGGPPTIDLDGFTVVASHGDGPAPTTAEWTAIYGPPGGYLGMGAFTITTRRLATPPIDIQLRSGVWNDVRTIGDRTIHLTRYRSVAIWRPEPELEIEISSWGGAQPVEEVMVGLRPADLDEFATAVAGIETTAADLDVVATVTFPSGAAVELLGGTALSPRGICLTIGGTRRCDLALMARSGYNYADTTMVGSTTDLIFDGRRWTILKSDAAPPDAAEFAGDWYLIDHAIG